MASWRLGVRFASSFHEELVEVEDDVTHDGHRGELGELDALWCRADGFGGDILSLGGVCLVVLKAVVVELFQPLEFIL